jgi:hypothetical protein
VRNGQQNNLVDPTADQMYVQGKELQQEKAQNTNTTTNLNLCMKGKVVIIIFIHVIKPCIVFTLYCGVLLCVYFII